MNVNSMLSLVQAEVADVISNPMKAPEKFLTAVETGRDFVTQAAFKMLQSDQAKAKEEIKRLDASFAGFVKHVLK